MTDNASKLHAKIKEFIAAGQHTSVEVLQQSLPEMSGNAFTKARKELEELKAIKRNHAKYDWNPPEPKVETTQEKIKKNIEKIEKGNFDFTPILQIVGLVVYICITVINSYLSYVYFHESLNAFISLIYAGSFILFSSMSFIGKFISKTKGMANVYLTAFIVMVVINTFFALAGQINGYYLKQSNKNVIVSSNESVIKSIKEQTERNKKALDYVQKQLESCDVSDKTQNYRISNLKIQQADMIAKIDKNESDLRNELKQDKTEQSNGVMTIYKILAGGMKDDKEGLIRLACYISPCMFLEIMSALSLYFALFIRRETKKEAK